MANAGGFVVAHLIYSPLAHGFTGDHGRDLTLAQYLAHTIGLIAVGLIVLSAQRAALSQYWQLSRTRVIVATVVFAAAFWFGGEALSPPADWMLGFTVLGTASWLGLPRREGAKKLWAIGAVLSFWIGIALALATGLTWVRLFHPTSASLVDHTVSWLILGGTTGVVGGYLSGWPLARLLNLPEATQTIGVAP